MSSQKRGSFPETMSQIKEKQSERHFLSQESNPEPPNQVLTVPEPGLKTKALKRIEPGLNQDQINTKTKQRLKSKYTMLSQIHIQTRTKSGLNQDLSSV